MPHLNNIANIRINNVSSNGVVNMGSAVLEGLAGNIESVGGQAIIGDEYASPVTHDYALNFYNDADIIDQSQTNV